tara:strand:+ start:905 stop:1765 length:861 start_codon:yes stop_codon:yes gene_type:complete
MVHISNLRKKYLEDGFIVIKSLFDKNYIRKLRPKMIDLSKTYENTQKEILLDTDVRKLLLKKELIETINEILNTNNLLYYADSNVVNHKNPFKSRNGFHHDARGEDPLIPYENEYPIVRAAIYFENYKDYSGGLKIKEKSHRYFCFLFRRVFSSLNNLRKIIFTKTRYSLNSIKLGKSINLELEEGDVVIWNLKTHHCGTSRRLKWFPKISLQPNIEKLLPSSIFLPTQYEQDRCSIFSTFAKKDLKDKNILGYLKIKTNKARLDQIRLQPDLLKELSERSCELVN